MACRSHLLCVVLLCVAGCFIKEAGQPMPCCEAPLPRGPKSDWWYSVTGVVRDLLPYERPVPGASVFAVRDESQFGPVTTGPDGRFRLDVPRRDLDRHAVDIIIEADGFEPRRVRFLLSKTETRELAIVLQPTGAAAGSK